MSDSARQLARDARRALRAGPAAIAEEQRTHLAEIVRYARARSPFYRELYRDLPGEVDDPTLLPVTDKKLLMSRFDDWVTDRTVTLERVQAFVADPTLVGQPFQDRYLVATTSGTSGLRGLFVLDERNQAVHTSLGSRAMAALGVGDVVRTITHLGRTAVIAASGGHFLTTASTARFRQDSRLAGQIMRVFPLNQPLPELVADLNRYNPASVAGFLSVLTLLAEEQEAGRLHIRPVLLIPGGETATSEAVERIARAFRAKVRPSYACTECTYLSFSCAHGWYHVNSDWAVVEPVDADHRPVPPGEPSHTVLISNLANRVQPILRYDLGDSVLLRPDPCPCGSLLPAIRVQGRAADVLTFPGVHGEQVSLSPMLFGTLLDRVPGVEQFQVVQTAPTTLRVRLQPGAAVDPDRVWHAVHDGIDRLLTDSKAEHVTVERADEPPQPAPSGKYRRVVPFSA
jgi:phenylacetate-coenzyme A ligase PaaK-like adenylate-forming protein